MSDERHKHAARAGSFTELCGPPGPRVARRQRPASPAGGGLLAAPARSEPYPAAVFDDASARCLRWSETIQASARAEGFGPCKR